MLKTYRDAIKMALRKYDIVGDVVGDAYVLKSPTTIERVLPILAKGDYVPAVINCNHRDKQGNKVSITWAFVGYYSWPEPTFTFQAVDVTLIEAKYHASV